MSTSPGNLAPLVSVVIVANNRSENLLPATQSALDQTYDPIEVIVLVAETDVTTIIRLEEYRDDRLRVLTIPESTGESSARNFGVRQACGAWIAFLRHDDLWLPEKLAKQMSTIRSGTNQWLILASRYIDHSSESPRIQPRRLPHATESIDTYLCCPEGFGTRGESLSASTLLIPKSLLHAVPYETDLDEGQDFLWLIQAGALRHATLCVLPDVLTICNWNNRSPNDSNRRQRWQRLNAQVRQNRILFTPHAYSYCIATRVLPLTVEHDGSFHAKLQLLEDSVFRGAASLKCIFTFLCVCLLTSSADPKTADKRRLVPKRESEKHSQMGAA